MFSHILIPVAPGHAGEYDLAIDAARKLLNPGGKISALAVMEEIPTYVEAYVPLSQLEANIEEAQSELKGALGDKGVETHVVKGHAANSIITWGEGHGAECIVLKSHKPGFGDYFLGSTASRVVRHANCPVLVLR